MRRSEKLYSASCNPPTPPRARLPPATIRQQTLSTATRYRGSMARSSAHNTNHGARWPSDKQRPAAAGMSTALSPSAAAAIGAPRRDSGDMTTMPPTRNHALASTPNKHSRKRSVGPVADRWGRGGQDNRHNGKGLTRGERIAVSHRHYDIRTAVEVLKRWPLPEKAVWRKMRQIIAARRG